MARARHALIIGSHRALLSWTWIWRARSTAGFRPKKSPGVRGLG